MKDKVQRELEKEKRAIQREADEQQAVDVEQTIKRGRSKTTRVNFNMDSDEYEVFQGLLEKGGQSVSAVLRLLVKKFVCERREDTFAASVVSETGPMKEEKANVA